MTKLIKTLLFIAIGFFLGWQMQPSLTSLPEPIAEESQTPNKTFSLQAEPQSHLSWEGIFSDPKILNNDQLGSVIELLKTEMDVDEQNSINLKLTSYARQLLESNHNFHEIEKKLIALLGNSETKEVVLDYLARLYEKNERYVEAINTLHDLREMTHYTDDLVELNNRIAFLVNSNIARLEESFSWDRLDAFYGLIIHKEPDNFDYQMRYAEFSYNNKNYDQATAMLEVLVYHQDYMDQAQKLIGKIKHQKHIIESGEFPVPVTKTGDHYIVTAIINDQEPVKLIIDTGASLTVLSPEIMRGLNIEEKDVLQYMNFSTANGVVSAPVILVDKIKVQNYIVSNVKVGILPSFSRSNVDGLLGMNFLNQFAFFIDQENSMLELSAIN